MVERWLSSVLPVEAVLLVLLLITEACEACDEQASDAMHLNDEDVSECNSRAAEDEFSSLPWRQF